MCIEHVREKQQIIEYFCLGLFVRYNMYILNILCLLYTHTQFK